jgi:hypothetical protein
MGKRRTIVFSPNNTYKENITLPLMRRPDG